MLSKSLYFCYEKGKHFISFRILGGMVNRSVFAGLLLLIGLWGAQSAASEVLSETDTGPSASFQYPHSIQKNSSLYDELRALDFAATDIFALVKAAEPFENLNRMRPGVEFRTGYRVSPQLEVGVVEFRLSPTRFLYLEKDDQGSWRGEEYEKKAVAKVTEFQGVVTDSLWNSARASEMDASIIAQLAEIFAWQVDFSREVRKGDRWRLSVERLFVENEFVGWGRILAAEYINEEQSFQAVLFEKDGEVLGYFAPDGSSMQKMFLKSPIEFARISSRFSLKRFHPILKKNRPHRGVDYAAPTGTPIRAIGDGRITNRNFTRGGGNTLTIQHTEKYQTKYMHLHRFAKGVQIGSRVKQGQVIGYVGATGLATGPHLHFEFYEYGRYVDPLRVEVPSAESVPEELLASFIDIAGRRIASLPQYDGSQQLVDLRMPSSQSGGDNLLETQ